MVVVALTNISTLWNYSICVCETAVSNGPCMINDAYYVSLIILLKINNKKASCHMLWLPPFISLQWSTVNIYVTSDDLKSSLKTTQDSKIKSNKYVLTQMEKNFTIDSCL